MLKAMGRYHIWSAFGIMTAGSAIAVGILPACNAAHVRGVEQDPAQASDPNRLLEQFARAFNYFGTGRCRCRVESTLTVHHIGLPEGSYQQETLFTKQSWDLAGDGRRQRIAMRAEIADVGKSDLSLNRLNSIEVIPDFKNSFPVKAIHISPRPDVKAAPQDWGVTANSDLTASRDRRQQFFDSDLRGFPFGEIDGDARQTLMDVFRKGRNQVATDEMLDGRLCAVLVSRSDFGTRTLWLDKSDEYRPVRLRVVREGDDLANDARISSFDGSNSDGSFYPKRRLRSLQLEITDLKFQKIGISTVLSNCVETDSYHYEGGGKLVLKRNWDITGIDLEPKLSDADFTIGSIVPEGTKVVMENATGIAYEWRDGLVQRLPATNAFAQQAGVKRGGRAWTSGMIYFMLANVVVFLAVSAIIYRRRGAASTS